MKLKRKEIKTKEKERTDKDKEGRVKGIKEGNKNLGKFKKIGDKEGG